MLKNTQSSVSCDVLVVGAGLAGLRAAYDCATAGLQVQLAVKGILCSGASFYPLTAALGCQMPKDEEDKSVFLEEVLETGAGVADPKLVKVIIDEILLESRRLPELGINQEEHMLTGRAACFAKTKRKMADWGGWGEIRRKARDIFEKIENIALREHCDLVRLVTAEDRIAGAILCDKEDNLITIHTGAVILATGGYCGLYKHSLNTSDVCGIGHSVALDAGADLINIEFMQFIPGLTAPHYQTLFNEYTLVHTLRAENDIGEDAMHAYLPADVLQAQCFAERALHGPFTTDDRGRYFDLAIMDDAIRRHSEKGFTLHYSPEIFTEQNAYCVGYIPFLKSVGVDLHTQKISVAPFAHCANGGIRIDIDGATAVPGLFAAGESAGGVHGADRHGGLATANSIVFGKRSAAAAVKYVKANEAAPDYEDAAAVDALLAWLNAGNGKLSAKEAHEAVSELLWYRGNVLREGKLLREGLEKIQMLRKDYNALQSAEEASLQFAIQVYHALRTAEALLLAMISREESRGSHFRSDFPNRVPDWEGKRLVLNERDGALKVECI